MCDGVLCKIIFGGEVVKIVCFFGDDFLYVFWEKFVEEVIEVFDVCGYDKLFEEFVDVEEVIDGILC